MVRNVDYQSRRKEVLACTINRYIKTAAPVASEDIAAEFSLSSATIRNIFADLEKEGFLTHPYTSGGRIPTQNGYRYYVDFLISQMRLLEDKKRRIAVEYNRQLKRLEDALEETSEVISTVTRYAGIVSFADWQDRIFYRGISYVLDQPEFHNLQRIRLLMRMMEDRRRLLKMVNRDFSERVKVYIGKELDYPEMEDCSLVVSNYHRGSRLSGKVAVLGPVRMEYSLIIPALEDISDTLSAMMENF